MLLTEFIEKTTAYNNNGQWTVEIPIARSPKPGRIFIDECECDSEYEAKERAFLYLQEYFDNKENS